MELVNPASGRKPDAGFVATQQKSHIMLQINHCQQEYFAMNANVPQKWGLSRKYTGFAAAAK